MLIDKIIIENFRGYKDEVVIQFEKLTAFIGKNDAGKSTILEALDIFFEGQTKMDKEDINKDALQENKTTTVIGVSFKNCPEKIVIDSTNETDLGGEFLLNKEGKLEIIKEFNNGGKPKIYIKANHPQHHQCCDLLSKKQRDLKNIITTLQIDCPDLKINSVMRKSIWNHFKNELNLGEINIDVAKIDEKNIWEKLRVYLPIYSLFKSDRSNSDGDTEVQDPIKYSVRQILQDPQIKHNLDEIAKTVRDQLTQTIDNTLEKIREMNPDLAKELNPLIPDNDSLKWGDVFKNVSLTGEQNIPINKRGSGIRRLILLNFFRAEAERKQTAVDNSSIIYAIEEPETSQHSDHQKKLIDSFKLLSTTNNTQTIITTHSPSIVKMLDFDNIKLVIDKESPKIINVQKSDLPYPSLNEVNYLAFEEACEEYHNELYGYIEERDELKNYKMGKKTVLYIKMKKGKKTNENITLTEYIRHQIHHPENTENTRYTAEDLRESIEMMRNFIENLENE